MPKIQYVPKSFQDKTLRTIAQVSTVIEEYQSAGYTLTLRQAYYQLVARGLIPNRQREYKRLGSIISDARRAGLIDWNAIEDRTRNLERVSSWDDPSDIIETVAQAYRIDLWENQPYYVEVWFEKDALMGVFERICEELRLPYFSCRGYTSDSEVWGAGRRLGEVYQGGRQPVVLHFGDHDPSGIDMTRDVEDRLRMFGSRYGLLSLEVRRLALNMDQVEEYDPPPNPAKDTDARFQGYQDLYGDESWELDALEPQVLADLVRTEVESLIDQGRWEQDLARETEEKALLRATADSWEDVVEFLEGQ